MQARAARQHQSAPLRFPAGLDEQIREGRVRLVGARVRQHGLKAGHELQPQLGATRVVQLHGAQFSVILGANQNRDGGAQRIALGVKLDPVSHEAGMVAPARARSGRRSERDHATLAAAPEVKEAAVAVAQQIVTPTCDVAPLPAAEPGAIGSQCDVVATVRQQMGGFPSCL